jgi:hypothetical protein
MFPRKLNIMEILEVNIWKMEWYEKRYTHEVLLSKVGKVWRGVREVRMGERGLPPPARPRCRAPPTPRDPYPLFIGLIDTVRNKDMKSYVMGLLRRF